MESSRRAARVKLAIAANGLAGGQRFDVDTPLSKLLERLGLGPQLPVCARTDEQAPRQLLEHQPRAGSSRPYSKHSLLYEAVQEGRTPAAKAGDDEAGLALLESREHPERGKGRFVQGRVPG